MTSLPAYLPLDRRLALGAQVALPDRVQGAALFADISGFTSLTAALYREMGARRGAEAIIAQLNRVFTGLVGEVHAHGGAAINFGGDSITCWFDDRPGDATPAARRALACAAALQRAMTALAAVTTPGGTVIPLDLKVGVAAGPARRFLAGDPDSYVLEVLAGPTLDRMAAAEELARPGEVVVATTVLEAVGSPTAVREWRHDAYGAFAVIDSEAQTDPDATRYVWPETAQLDDATARPWLLPPVYSHLQHAPEAFLAELRTTTTLFLRFSGIDYDDDAAGPRLNDYVRRVQDVLNRYEGFLLHISMGDKGGYLHASFGAPVAHEDDAARAAAAALEIARLTEAIDYLDRPQIGISSGLVHSGAYGSPDRRTYGVVGNEVNISARLMTAATPGQILISSRVAEQLAGAFETQAMPPIALKGLRQPFTVSALRGRLTTTPLTDRRRSDRQLVGRTTEQAVIASMLHALVAGQSGVLVIEGEAGIGKSLLVDDLVQQAADLAAPGGSAPLRVLSGYGDAIEQSTPYYAWRPIVEQAFGLPGRESGAPPDAAGRDQVVAALEPDLRHLAPLLNAVLPLDLPETPLTEQITGEARQDAIYQLVAAALRRMAAEGPLVVVLDDAHWLDSASWTMARRIQRDIEPLLLVLVTRPMGDERPATFEALCQLPVTHQLPLDTLDPAAIEELVGRRLGVDGLPPEVTRLIRDKAEGHPFFSEELAYALRDSGLLETAGGQARLVAGPDELQALDFPNSIEGVITSRIDALPATEQLTVKVASVVGRIFAFHILQAIYPTREEPAALLENLDHLARLDITPLETPEPELSHYFRHILTQEVVYELMTTDQKQRLHHAAAVWYERAETADQTRTIPLIAHHYHMAGDLAQAAAYYGLAGENAFRDFANEEAVRSLELALAMCDADTPALQRAHWHALCGEANYRLTRMAQSQEHYRTALGLLGYDLPESATGRGLRLAGQLIRQLAHRQMPGRFVGRATGDDRAVMLEAARIYDGLAEVVYNEGDQLTAFLGIMSTLNLSEQAGPSPELLRSYANMATTTAIASRSIADGYRARAMALDADNDDLAARAAIQIPLSVDSVWVGAWDRAEAEIAVALDIYSRLGEWRRWGVAAWLLPQVSQAQGRLAEARERWAELYGVTLRSEDTRHQVRSRGGQFFNFLTLDQPDQALVAAAEVDELLAQNPEMVPVEERMWHGVRAARALLTGDTAEALEQARLQLEATGRASLKFDLLDVFAGPAEVLLRLWEQGAATAADAQEGCKAISSFARFYPFARPRADRLNGRYAWQAGKAQQAEKLWDRGLARAEALAMPYERALILADRGGALGRADDLAEAEALRLQCRSADGPM